MQQVAGLAFRRAGIDSFLTRDIVDSQGRSNMVDQAFGMLAALNNSLSDLVPFLVGERTFSTGSGYGELLNEVRNIAVEIRRTAPQANSPDSTALLDSQGGE